MGSREVWPLCVTLPSVRQVPVSPVPAGDGFGVFGPGGQPPELTVSSAPAAPAPCLAASSGLFPRLRSPAVPPAEQLSLMFGAQGRSLAAGSRDSTSPLVSFYVLSF